MEIVSKVYLSSKNFLLLSFLVNCRCIGSFQRYINELMKGKKDLLWRIITVFSLSWIEKKQYGNNQSFRKRENVPSTERQSLFFCNIKDGNIDNRRNSTHIWSSFEIIYPAFRAFIILMLIFDNKSYQRQHKEAHQNLEHFLLNNEETKCMLTIETNHQSLSYISAKDRTDRPFF